jgi:hypothetical protein
MILPRISFKHFLDGFNTALLFITGLVVQALAVSAPAYEDILTLLGGCSIWGSGFKAGLSFTHIISTIRRNPSEIKEIF